MPTKVSVQHPLREVSKLIVQQSLEHERDGQILEATILEIAKRKCCRCLGDNCLNCCFDCPFAGDKNYGHVIENARKVVNALALGVFDEDIDVLNNAVRNIPT